MCGRFTLTVEPSELLAEFGITTPDDYRPRYNIAPTQPVLAVVAGAHGWVAGDLIWGLVPSWAPDRKGAQMRINARSETVIQKPTFRDSFQHRRCLILADGFYEWQGTEKHRRPMLIKRKDSRPFAFAGLWDRWQNEEQSLASCTILTTSANQTLRSIHDRMPVILSRRDQETWLDASNPDELISVLRPYPDEPLHAFAVSSLVNSAANESPDCVIPV